MDNQSSISQIRRQLGGINLQILYSQSSSQFVLIRVPSWLISSHRPEMPNLPILPSWPLVLLPLVHSALLPFVPLCLCGYKSIMQNKPNSQNQQSPQPVIPQRVTPISLPALPQKTNPNKPNQRFIAIPRSLRYSLI